MSWKEIFQWFLILVGCGMLEKAFEGLGVFILIVTIVSTIIKKRREKKND